MDILSESQDNSCKIQFAPNTKVRLLLPVTAVRSGTGSFRATTLPVPFTIDSKSEQQLKKHKHAQESKNNVEIIHKKIKEQRLGKIMVVGRTKAKETHPKTIRNGTVKRLHPQNRTQRDALNLIKTASEIKNDHKKNISLTQVQRLRERYRQRRTNNGLSAATPS